MTCPRCSVGALDEKSGQCVLCGFVPGATVVSVDRQAVDEVQETVQRELEEKFKINVLLRHGARSVVYLADEVGTNRLVALKVIPQQRGMSPDRQLFEREATIAASLSHAHIASVYDYGQTAALVWYSMEYVKGRSLAEILRDAGQLDLEVCQKILEQVASALDYMHRGSVVHGNIKPSNILVSADRWAVVSDPCIMGAVHPRTLHGSSRVLSGTPEYMAPEQFWTRSPGASADQYALAVVAYECLTGTLPVVGDSPEEMEQLHRSEKLLPLTDVTPDVPAHVSDAVLKALGKAPGERFATVLDFTAMLRRDLAPQPARSSLPGGRPSTPSRVFVIEQPKPRRMWLWAVGAVAALAAAGAGIWYWPFDALPWTQREAPVVAAPPPATPTPVPAAQPEPAPPRTETAQTRQEPATPPAARPAARPTTQAPTQQQPAVAPGRLLINATPWGQVFVDGELIGNSPRVMAIPAGTHTVRVVRDGYVPFETEIEIAPGQERRLVNIVLQPRQP